MQQYNTILNFSQLVNGKIYEFNIEDKKIAIVKKEDSVFAFAATCPHAGAKFCEGWLDPLGNVVCPLHKYKFNIRNGYNVTGEGYKLKTYIAKVVNDIVIIQI